MSAIDAPARQALAESERTGRPLVFTGSECSWYAEDDPGPGDLPPLTAERLVRMVELGELDDEHALELAESLCEEPFTDDDVADDPGRLDGFVPTRSSSAAQLDQLAGTLYEQRDRTDPAELERLVDSLAYVNPRDALED